MSAEPWILSASVASSQQQGAFPRIVAISAILSLPFAAGCLYLSLLAVGFDVTALEDPGSAIALGSRAAELLFWSMILDMLGYYLLLAPAAIYLWYRCRERDPGLATLCTFCGLGYVLIGAAGAAILAAAGKPMMVSYTTASDVERAMLEVSFATLTYVVHGALWNVLEVLLAAVWFIGTGLLLRREHRWFGNISVIVGVGALLDSGGNIFQATALAGLGLNVYLVLTPLWACWLGLSVLRGRWECAVQEAGATTLRTAPRLSLRGSARPA